MKIAADTNGKSDPYVKIYFQGKKWKSKIKEKTLEPVKIFFTLYFIIILLLLLFLLLFYFYFIFIFILIYKKFFIHFIYFLFFFYFYFKRFGMRLTLWNSLMSTIKL